ncbi:MAG: sel1 repeat family protein [Alphaproteobacteria bacterium]|nr:sel1 repeat family protein [Alphaproteobacteria bacterium]
MLVHRAAAMALCLVASPLAAQDWARSCAIARGQDKVLACNQALKTAPGDVALRRHLGRALLDIGDGMGGANEFGAIAEEKQTDALAWYEYAAALATDYRFADAAKAIERSLALDPQPFEANKIAVLVYERTGRETEAYRANLRLAALGDRIAMNGIAEALLEGRGVPADPGAAVPWLVRAAEAGHFGAMALLARVYAEGLYGQALDAVRAEYWNRKADATD